ncbi:MAG: CarD family transcriptional regulator [Elusimicrobiaceae bacterium]|nr:CarD family transcriptional regulator [Elusimicrobiaceae bacterium]
MPAAQFPLGELTGLNGTGSKAYYLLALIARTGAAVYIGPSDEELSEMHDALAGVASLFYPDLEFDTVFLGAGALDKTAALEPLARRQKNRKLIITATPDAITAPLPSRTDYLAKSVKLDSNAALPRHRLLDALETAGYKRAEFVEEPGEYAARGSVIDIFSPVPQYPVRLYFSGNEIESIRMFDIDSQATKSLLKTFTALPLAFERETATLAGWLDGGCAWVVDRSLASDADFSRLPSFENRAVFLPQEKTGAPGAVNLDFARSMNFTGNFRLLENEIKRLRQTGLTVILSCLNRGELERFDELLANGESRRLASFAISALKEGFIYRPGKIAVITSSEVLNRRYAASSLLAKYDRSRAKRIRFKDLAKGDYVVHEDYGISRYLGLKTLTPHGGGEETECLALEFKNRHRLYVPLYDFRKIQKFIGGGGRPPRLSLLGGKTWNEVKNRVKENVRETARELLKNEALRAGSHTDALLGDPRIETEFADSFPYEETEDQRRAIRAVLADLALDRPMDRVLIGDVGFGKTEVAMRAAMRAALSGRQTAVLVPTTVLAAQHYRTFTERMAGFPVSIAMLSRFQPPAEQKKTVADIKAGIHDIVIGTHRLLSKDIGFKALGLSIIDEEHRFGVKQKEKIRSLKSGGHCLLLSATPIPRTMNQALANLRSISVIETPPRGRVPIHTRVMPWNDDVAASAVRDELARGGQVFYVHNRVRTLPSRMAHLKKIMPEIKICMGHGQMREAELEKTMWSFYSREYDVLLASTIIESGLDVPGVNTLIVENAHEFGLAQLYQLRGRIGRGSKKANCYLFYPAWLEHSPLDFVPDAEIPGIKPSGKAAEDGLADEADSKSMSEEARKRLSALMEFGELGSGFRLALRDLEIRGAGELLGTNQHGFLNEVGLNFFCELLAGEVKRQQGTEERREETASVEINAPAFIPESYLPDENERLRCYKRLLDAEPPKARVIFAELADLCGPVPESVLNIAAVVELRRLAGRAGIRSLEQTETGFELTFRKGTRFPPQAPGKILEMFKGAVRFTSGPSGDGMKIMERSAKPLEFARDAVLFLSSLAGK